MNEKIEELFKDIPNLNIATKKSLSLQNIADSVNTYVCETLIPERRYEDAKSYLENCIQIAPLYSYPYLTMAEISLLQKREEEAFEWLQRAIHIQPDITYEIDTLECFASLRFHPKYLDLFHQKLHPQSKKSFYFLEIFYQIQGTTLQLLTVSRNTDYIEKVIRDELKTEAGFYTLLKYEKDIRIHCYKNGLKTGELDMRPYLNIRITDKLVASFTAEGKPNVKDWDGDMIHPDELYDMLYGYHMEDEQEETVLFGAWKEMLGNLTGEIISNKEPIQIIGESSIWNVESDKIYEIEEGKLIPYISYYC